VVEAKKGSLQLDRKAISRPEPEREYWKKARAAFVQKTPGETDNVLSQAVTVVSSGEKLLFDDGFTRDDMEIYYFDDERVRELQAMAYQTVDAFDSILERENASDYLKDLNPREKTIYVANGGGKAEGRRRGRR
jgi:hypothetical protein